MKPCFDFRDLRARVQLNSHLSSGVTGVGDGEH